MKKTLLPIAALALLLTACEHGGEEEANTEVSHAPVPGSKEDFHANVKDRVFFDFDKSAIPAGANGTIISQSAWLKTYPNTSAVIEGHTDSRGTAAYNLALGARRASAVKKALVSNGVEASRLKEVSYGKERLEQAGDNEAAHAANRRAVTVIN